VQLDLTVCRRHQSLNDIEYRAFVIANISVTKEPACWPVPKRWQKAEWFTANTVWQAGKCLTRDVTSTHTLADCVYVPNTFTTARGAAEMAANRKMDKYAALTQSHILSANCFRNAWLNQRFRSTLPQRAWLTYKARLLEAQVIHFICSSGC
jgi:hypothetical protein